MTDIATLGLEIRSDDVVVASDRLKQLASDGAKAEGATKKLSSSFGDMEKYIQAAQAALAAFGIATFIKRAIDAALQMERLNQQFKVFTGNASLAARELEFVRNEANRLGLASVELTTSYGRFLNAIKGTANEGEKGRKAFVGISEGMAAIRLAADEQSRIWAQLNQGLMKGKFEMEDLKTINEAGLPIFKLMADALGKDVSVIMKMQAEGKILAADVLPKIGESMHQAFGVSALEGANSAQAAINRMNNAMMESKAALGAALIPAFTDAVKAAVPFLNVIKEIIGGLQIMAIKAASSMDKAAGGGFKGFLSSPVQYMAGKMFGTGITAAQAQANEDAAIADLMKRYTPSGSDYSAAEKLRQASNKSTKPLGDDKGAAAAEKWASTYRQLAKEIEALNPIMSEHDKKLLDVSAKYAELERKKGANINKLRELKAHHLQAIETAYQTAEAINATSNEFKEYLRIAGDESAWSQTADSVDEYHRKFRESVEDMDAATKAARDVANGIYDIERAFSEAGQSTAIETFINNLFKLKDVLNSTTDINISMAESDPAAQQMAAIEERYRREAELIQQKRDALEEANLTETAMYRALSDNILAMASKREQDIANIQRKQAEEGWQGVVSVAQKAFPKLTGLDKAVTAAFKDHTKYRLELDEKRTDGAMKLVKDETRSNLSMYSSYAGAAGAVFEGLAATQDTTSRAGFETAKALNIGVAVMSTAAAIMRAFSDLGYPAGIPAAVLAAATGAIQIATIASTEFGGTAKAPPAPSAGSFGGGGTGSSTVGTKIGVALQDPLQAASNDSLQLLAESAESASLAIGDMVDVFERIAATFEEGIGASLVSRAYGLLQGSVINTPREHDSNTADRFNDETFQAGINAIFNDALQSLNAAAVGLGMDASKQISSRGIWFDGNWQEEDIKKALEGFLQSSMDAFAKTFDGLEEYAKAGENASDALIRLNTALWAFNDAADLAGITLLDGLSGANMASKIADVLGGTDEMTDVISAYFQAVFTDTEQEAMEAAKSQRDVQAAFNKINANAVLQANNQYEAAIKNVTTTVDRTLSGAFDAAGNLLGLASGEAEKLAALGLQVPKTADEFYSLARVLATLPATTAETAAAQQRAQDELQKTLAATTLQVPKTREEFRNLVESISSDIRKYTDLAATVADVQLSAEYQKQADSAASTFAALMNVSEAFGTVMDAADETAAKLREYQDLEVRLLNAQGNTAAADALERQLSAERELQDAIASGMDAAYIARLKEVLALEEQAAASESAAAATAKASEALTNATKAAESSVASITSAFANLTKAQATADAQRYGATVGGVQLSGSEYKSFGNFVTFLDQAAGELQKIADMGFPAELQAAVDQITAMVDTASRQLAGQVASQRILAGDAAGALAAYTKWTMPTDGYSNSDGSFNAGAFNSQYLRNQAHEALALGAQASANALKVVDAMQVMGAFDYSGNTELQMFALWDNIAAFSRGYSEETAKEVTVALRPALDALSQMQVATEYAPQGPGINAIKATQMQQTDLKRQEMIGTTMYHGTPEIAYGRGVQELNGLLDKGTITLEQFTGSMVMLENATGVTADTLMTLADLEAAQVQAEINVKNAGISSMNFYLTQISSMGKELIQVAIDTGTALGKVTESIGRMKSWSDVLTYSVNAAGDFADLAQNKGRADISRAIAAAAADAQTRLTTADAAAAQPVLQGMSAFAGMDTVKLRDISLLIDGLKQFDSESFEQAFTRMSAALVDGMITIDQYAALYSYSMQVYEGTAKSALETLKQTGSDAMQILENAINKAKEAAQVTVDQLSGLSDGLHSLIEGLQTPTDETLINRQAAQAQLRELVASGGMPATGEFDAAMKALAEPSKQLFGSYQAYAEDYYKTAIDLSALSARTDSQLSIAEQEIQRLDNILKTAQDQWDVAMGTKLAVMSVEDAVVNLQNAIIALSQGQTPALAVFSPGLASFDVGTNFLPTDMIAQIHAGERIIPAADNYELMRRLDSPIDNAELIAELKELRAEVSQLRSEQRAGHGAIAANTDRSARTLDKFDRIGMPPVREAA